MRHPVEHKYGYPVTKESGGKSRYGAAGQYRDDCVFQRKFQCIALYPLGYVTWGVSMNIKVGFMRLVDPAIW